MTNPLGSEQHQTLAGWRANPQSLFNALTVNSIGVSKWPARGECSSSSRGREEDVLRDPTHTHCPITPRPLPPPRYSSSLLTLQNKRLCNLESISGQLKILRHNYLFPQWGRAQSDHVCNGFTALTRHSCPALSFLERSSTQRLLIVAKVDK